MDLIMWKLMDLPWWDFDDGFVELKMYIKSQGKL